MADSKTIERAVRSVRNQKSFIQNLLVDALGWEIDERADDIEQISFEWSAEDLRVEGLDQTIADGIVRQIRPNRQSPWGIFILEFNRPEVFTTGRGMTGTLRKVLRGLVPSKRKHSHLTSFKCENLLFICNHDYQHFRFAHFKSPEKQSATPPLAAFGWGPGDPIRTLCDFNLSALDWPAAPGDAAGWIAEWSQAFDVEKVTKRFYEDYARVFEKVEKLIGRQKELKDDELRMFTQTLFNRLMFLRFMERKGWLTFGGEKNYLRALYAAGGHGKRSFYRGRLCPLFFEGLAAEGKQESPAYGSVAYLNGGLFERSPLDQKVTDLPDDVFKDILSDEQHGGLFYRYNFTVEESTPLDIEVAVDPEMLGKVFEELVTGRHESGSYYTPRPVVSFMCREALKGYLADKTKASADAIAALVERQDVSKLKETHAREILAALDDLKAVDPACGSGAYLLGLLQEMILLYRQLYSEKLVKNSRTLYDLKLRIISQCLYGVDIDPFATNIAMLRLWLSLAVEADDPVPLPNLDFKIETGDSLLGPNPQEFQILQQRLVHLADALVNVKNQFFVSHGEDKESYRRTIMQTEAELRRSLNEQGRAGVIDWRIQFAEVFSRKRKGFDVVLANPPYVEFKNLPASTKALLGDYVTAKGKYDLYIPFIERSVSIAAPSSVITFICPTRFMHRDYGTQIRSYLIEHCRIIEIIDFSDHQIFEGAMNYTGVFAFAKPSVNQYCFAYRKFKHDTPLTTSQLEIALRGKQTAESANYVSILSITSDNLSAAPWYFGDSEQVSLLAKLKSGRQTLRELSSGIYQGIATGKDEVFVLDEQQASDLKIEKPLLQRMLKGKDIKRYALAWSGHFVLYPYDEQGKVFPENQLKTKFPSAYGYLQQMRSELSGRGYFEKSTKRWYELWNQRRLDRFRECKLVTLDNARRNSFCLDDSGYVGTTTVYSVVLKNRKPEFARFVLGVLNSSIAEYYHKKNTIPQAGGFYRYQASFIENIPVCEASEKHQAAIGELVDRIISLKALDVEADTSTLESDVDAIAYGLYGLSREEIAVIQKSKK